MEYSKETNLANFRWMRPALSKIREFGNDFYAFKGLSNYQFTLCKVLEGQDPQVVIEKT